MKKIRMFACALLLLCCGAIFVACGGDKEFNAEEINILNTYTYDGQAHNIVVNYKDVDLTVTYSTAEDGEFVSANEFEGYSDVGEYSVYYTITAEGYKSYTSSTKLNITAKDITVSVANMYYNVNTVGTKPAIELVGLPENEDLALEMFTVDAEGEETKIPAEGFDFTTLTVGDVVTVRIKANNPNYNATCVDGKIYAVDDVAVANANGVTRQYHTFEEAVAGLKNNESIVLYNSVEISNPLELKNNVKIYGNDYTIKASDGFVPTKERAQMLLISGNAEISNVVLDASETSRVLAVGANAEAKLNNVTIKNGYTSNQIKAYYTAGIFAKNFSRLELNNCKFENNKVDPSLSGTTNGTEDSFNANTYYVKYSTDLFIGAGANCVINGGELTNAFANANGNYASHVVVNGTKIENFYLEIADVGAELNVSSAEINNLLVAFGEGEFKSVVVGYNATYVAGNYYEQK